MKTVLIVALLSPMTISLWAAKQKQPHYHQLYLMRCQRRKKKRSKRRYSGERVRGRKKKFKNEEN
jgi:hypothetical protein